MPKIDLENLDGLIRAYLSYFRNITSTSRSDRLEAESGDPLDEWLSEALIMRKTAADEAAWPVVVAMVEAAPDERSLAIVAAGPLEDLIVYHGAQFGDRLVDKTRSDPKFRDAVRGVFGLEKTAEPHRSRLLELLGTGDAERSPIGPQRHRKRRRGA